MTVPNIIEDLVELWKAERLVLDWRKRQQTRAGVQVTIRDTLNKLPETYNDELFRQKLELVYQHVYDMYPGKR